MGGNPETELQREITSAITEEGLRVMRLNSGGRRGRVRLLDAGTPDLLALPPYSAWFGVTWIEVKLPGEELRENQVVMHDDLRKRGQRVITVYSPYAAAGIMQGLKQSYG